MKLQGVKVSDSFVGVCLCCACFCRVCYGGNDGGVAHDGGMVGCEIVNEASNGTTW